MAELEIRLAPYGSSDGRNFRGAFYFLTMAVALILLIACANLANLLLARASARTREIAIRSSLGAGRFRIVRQMLAESFLLAVFGGAAGVAIAYAAIPALSLNTNALGKSIKQARESAALRRTLVISEVALSFVLLAGAGLLLKSFLNLLAVPSGMDESRVVAGKMSLRGDRYNTAAKAAALFSKGIEQIEKIPNVEGAAVTLAMPMERGLNYSVIVPDAPNSPEARKYSNWRYVTPNYFATMRIPIRYGRGFKASDHAGAATVAIVSEWFAKRNFGARNPIGLTLVETPGKRIVRTIVGVVADVKANSLKEDSAPTVYVPIEQAADGMVAASHTWFPMSWVVRTKDEGQVIGPAIEAAVRRVDPLLPFQGFLSMKDVRAKVLVVDRFLAALLSCFAGLALVLTAAGLYGTISHQVTLRLPEMGIKLALGARAESLSLSILGQGLLLTSAGLVLGAVCSIALSQWIKSYTFGLQQVDYSTFAACACLLLVIGAGATVGSASRVLRLSPNQVLRSE